MKDVWVIALASLVGGIWIGLRFGGHIAIRRITEFEHAERRRRAGLGR